MKECLKKILLVALAITMLLSMSITAFATDKAVIDQAVMNAARYMYNTIRNPQIGSIGGEWAVIGLARSGFNVPDSYFENYFRVVEQHVRRSGGVLHENRNTEYARVTLALTAAGFDPRNVAGFDLTMPLGDFERTVAQGINGPIWALIALDSLDYPMPINPNAEVQATRDMYIAEILRRQTHDGGWNLTAGVRGEVERGEVGDPDITGMALQALAKYQDRADVRSATNRALNMLSAVQDEDGGFSSWGDPNSESAVQVLVALTELGIPFDDNRFVKNGNTIVDNILSFQNADGSFNHTTGPDGNSQMASEQALYALVAVQRAIEGRNSLYRMSDVPRRGRGGESPIDPVVVLPNKHADVRPAEISHPDRTFDDITGHTNRVAIESLASRGIINGINETAFSPDATMKRAEFAAIVTRGLGLPERNISVFTDVPSSAWFSVAVGTAFYYEIITGTSATTFNPNGNITRQEAAVMIARAARLCGMDTELNAAAVLNILAPFGDYRIVSGWAQGALAFCFNEGILDDSEFYILPQQEIRRGEVAEMLYRVLGLANLL